MCVPNFLASNYQKVMTDIWLIFVSFRFILVCPLSKVWLDPCTLKILDAHLITFSKIIGRTCKVMWVVLSPIYLKSPKTEAEWKKLTNDFKELWNLPHIIGAIDGKHIAMKCLKYLVCCTLTTNVSAILSYWQSVTQKTFVVRVQQTKYFRHFIAICLPSMAPMICDRFQSSLKSFATLLLFLEMEAEMKCCFEKFSDEKRVWGWYSHYLPPPPATKQSARNLRRFPFLLIGRWRIFCQPIKVDVETV